MPNVSAAIAMLLQASAPVTAEVRAVAETVPVGTSQADAADDPAIWRNRRRPGASLIVATDKKAGLYVYGVDGAVRHFVAAGRVNNVDLVDLGRRGVIVVASDRNDEARALLQLYRLNTRTAQLVSLGAVEGGAGEAYGVCLLPRRGGVDAFSVLKDGRVLQVRVDIGGERPTGTTVRSFRLATQTEGCVVDPRTRTLFVGEEDRGIWAFDLRGAGPVGRLFAAADGRQLVSDVEGLALMPVGRRGGWLVASSQGDNSYALYRLADGRPAGRFRVVAGRVGSTEETDGIAVAPGSFGRDYPDGLLVVQDGDNGAAAQNFKLVSWRDVMRSISSK